MKIRLLSIILCILIFTSFSSLAASANETKNNPTFFSFFENYIVAYNVIDAYNNRVLAAHTTAVHNELLQIVTKSQSLSDVSAYLLNGINIYRATFGLSPVRSSSQTCAFATIRAKEIINSFSHDGFYKRVNNHTIPYARWSHATENIAEAPSYKNVVKLWADSSGHAANMRDNTPYICIQQYRNYYAFEGMRP